MTRLVSMYSVLGVTINLTDTRKTECVHILKVSYVATAKPDLSHLRSPAGLDQWQPLATLQLRPGQTQASVQLPLPVDITGVCLEVSSTLTSLQAQSQERLTCPRCSSLITDKALSGNQAQQMDMDDLPIGGQCIKPWAVLR
ncbi:auxin transport protein BIG, partial [Haematococcus lacustris]